MNKLNIDIKEQTNIPISIYENFERFNEAFRSNLDDIIYIGGRMIIIRILINKNLEWKTSEWTKRHYHLYYKVKNDI